MNNNNMKIDGLKLHTLKSNYENDITKNCGLLNTEVDSNFLFLRYNDIYNGEIKNNNIILYKSNGDTISIPGINETQIIQEGYFDKKNNTLIIKTNISDIVITGITVDDLFTLQTLKGNGNANNPLRLTELYSSPFLPSSKTVLDLTQNSLINEKYQTNGTFVITKEHENLFGKLYNYNAIIEIQEKLKNTSWRIPTNEDWGEMLNAIEPCETFNHLTLKNGDFGKFAGAYLKNDGEYWASTTETSFSYGFKALPCGFKISVDDNDSNYGISTRFWSNSMNEYDEIWVRQLDHNKSTVRLTAGDKSGFYSLRLVKDYDNNFMSSEEILGSEYPTVKMPYIKINENGTIIGKGVRVWTSININYETTENSFTNIINNEKFIAYYLNFWNGEYWEKRKIKENNIITIEDRNNKEYKLINNELKLLDISSGNDDIIDMNDYYKKNEVDNLINNLKSEIEYLSKIISHTLDISLTNNNGEKYDDEYINRLDTVIKQAEAGDGNEIKVTKEHTTLYIDINPNVLGEITNIK